MKIFYKQSLEDRIFDVVNTVFLLFCLIIVLYPLIYIFSSSFSSVNAVVGGKVFLLPVQFSLEGYKSVFKNGQILIGYRNSLIYVILGTSANVFMTIIAAYPLSRKDFRARNYLMGIFAFTMFFSGGLIPTFLLVKSLGLLDKIWAMVIPGAMSVWFVILMRTFFQTSIPDSLLEAAHLDGCSDIKFLRLIVLPLSKPIIAVIALFSAVGIWNSYFTALIYLTKPQLYPLQIILRNILILNQIENSMLGGMTDEQKMKQMQGMQDLMKFSLIVVASLPVLIIYPFVQKYFIKGIMIGAIKG